MYFLNREAIAYAIEQAMEQSSGRVSRSAGHDEIMFMIRHRLVTVDDDGHAFVTDRGREWVTAYRQIVFPESE